MNILILILASFSLFAASFEGKLKKLDQCLDSQIKIIDQHNKLSQARSRKVSNALEQVMKKYEAQYALTHVVEVVAAAVTFDTCPEDPASSYTLVGKIKGYRKKSSDFWKIDNDLSDLKFMSVNASFEITDFIYGRGPERKKLVSSLQNSTRKFDSFARKINALAGKYNQSYKVHSCQSLADSL